MPDITMTYMEQEDKGAVLVTLLIERRDKAGKAWQSSLTGRGLDRRDAVAAAVPGEAMMRLRAAILKVAEEKYVDASEVPAAHPPPSEEAPAETTVPPADAVEVAQPPKHSSLPVEPAHRQQAPEAAAALSPASTDSTEPASQPLTARKRGWPKGKPRGPRKVNLSQAIRITKSESPTTSPATLGTLTLETTESPKSPPQSSAASGEPF
jgi:hypothetical protein